MAGLGLPVETGVFSDTAPDEYIVLTPLADTFQLHADNIPEIDVQYVRVSLFSRGNYLAMKRKIETALLESDITITGRRYSGHENDTGYHNYAIDVAKEYIMEV